MASFQAADETLSDSPFPGRSCSFQTFGSLLSSMGNTRFPVIYNSKQLPLLIVLNNKWLQLLVETKGREALLDQQAAFSSVVSTVGTVCFIEKVMQKSGGQEGKGMPCVHFVAGEKLDLFERRNYCRWLPVPPLLSLGFCLIDARSWRKRDRTDTALLSRAGPWSCCNQGQS